MKHLLGAAALAVGAFAFSCLGGTQVAEAGTIVVDSGSGFTGANGGGEFKVTTFTGAGVPNNQGAGVQIAGGVFQTFCLERSESLAFGSTYDYTVDTAAVRGGFDGQDGTLGGLSSDSLDARTAYLYTKFWLGTLTGYDKTVGSGRAASATALQLAIWKIEQELVPTGGSGAADLSDRFNSLSVNYNALAKQFYDDAVANAGTGIGQVRVLNLTITSGGSVSQRQSLLVMVPLPSAAWLGLGMMSVLGVVGVIRRRKRQALV